jgi:hypothetical protein
MKDTPESLISQRSAEDEDRAVLEQWGVDQDMFALDEHIEVEDLGHYRRMITSYRLPTTANPTGPEAGRC